MLARFENRVPSKTGYHTCEQARAKKARIVVDVDAFNVIQINECQLCRVMNKSSWQFSHYWYWLSHRSSHGLISELAGVFLLMIRLVIDSANWCQTSMSFVIDVHRNSLLSSYLSGHRVRIPGRVRAPSICVHYGLSWGVFAFLTMRKQSPLLGSKK